MFLRLKATVEKGLLVTLRTQGCVDGLMVPSVRRTAGRDNREGTRCPTAGHPLTTPPEQLQVGLFLFGLLLFFPTCVTLHLISLIVVVGTTTVGKPFHTVV